MAQRNSWRSKQTKHESDLLAIGPTPVPLTVPRGATTEAGANAYEIKFPSSPTFINENPVHLPPVKILIGGRKID